VLTHVVRPTSIDSEGDNGSRSKVRQSLGMLDLFKNTRCSGNNLICSYTHIHRHIYIYMSMYVCMYIYIYGSEGFATLYMSSAYCKR
jgi:hypothetical protein